MHCIQLFTNCSTDLRIQKSAERKRDKTPKPTLTLRLSLSVSLTTSHHLTPTATSFSTTTSGRSLPKDTMNYRHTAIGESEKHWKGSREHITSLAWKDCWGRDKRMRHLLEEQAERHRQYEQLKLLSPLRKPWSSVVWVFVGALPELRDPTTKASRNAILVIWIGSQNTSILCQSESQPLWKN